MTESRAEIGTHHRLVTAELKWRKIEQMEEKKYSRIAIKRLKDADLKKRYQEETDSEFEILEREKRGWNLEDRWNKFKDIVLRVAEHICGRSKVNKHCKRTSWWNTEIQEEVKRKKKAWKQYNSTKSEHDRTEYYKYRKKVKELIREAKKKSWKDFGDEMEQSYKVNNRSFWNKIRALRGGKRKEIKGIRDKNNSIRTNLEEILETWREYYKNKYDKDEEERAIGTMGNQNEMEDNNNQTEEISIDEIEEGIRKIRIGKAGGADNIDPEMVKWLGKEGKKWLLEIMKEAWRTNLIPKDWEENLMVPIHKKGDEFECENYRDICLSPVAFKLYTRIVEGRLRKEIEGKLEEEQSAFRRERQTMDNIFILRNLIEKRNEQGKELYIMLIDLKAAFDSIDRDIIWKVMEELEITQKIIEVTKSTYNRVKGKVQMGGKRSKDFYINKGIKQGDSLSPTLFILIMDKIMKNTKKRTKHLQVTIGYTNMLPVKMEGLLYADDIILVADTQKKMQSLLNIWVEEIEKMNMNININKCKCMKIGKQEENIRNRDSIICKEEQIKMVSTCEYLGVMFTNDGKIDLEIANRARKATKIYYSLNNTIFSKGEIEQKTKLQVYNSISIPTILYGSETWVTNKKHESTINAAEMKQLRRIAGKTKMDRLRSDYIRGELKQEPIEVKIKKRKLNWYGHIIRMKQTRLVKRVMEAKRYGKRRKGRPRKSWLEQIEEIGRERSKTLQQMKKMAADRKNWKKWINED